MAGFCVRKPFTVLVVIVIIFALGITSFRSMKPELLPNIELPYVIAVTTYPGATSEQVEVEVTKPLEQTFSALSGLETISSQSQANYCMVMMEFVDGTNLDAISLDILQGIDRISGSWDDMIGTPIIIKMNPNMLPVMIAAVEREGADTTEMSRLMEEELQTKLEGIDGVASLSITGLRREQINVVIREDKVAKVNARMADAIEKEIDEKESELEDTKSELQGKLNDLKKSNTELENGVTELANGIGQGWASLPNAIVTELNSQLTNMKTQLTDVNAIFDSMVNMIFTLNPTVQSDIDSDVSSWMLAHPDASYSDIDAQREIITQQHIATNWPVMPGVPTYAELYGGIVALETGIAQVESQLALIVLETTQQVEGTLLTKSIETEFKMSSGAAALVAAQVQLSAGITQIETGLEQFEDALEDALKQADMSNVITMSMISTLLKAQNFEMPAGTVQQDNTEYLVRVGDKISSLEEMQSMALMDTGVDDIGVILLSDVADVFMSDNLEDVYARVNGNDGLLVQFSKQSEYSTTEVTDAIMDRFDQLSDQYTGLSFVPMMNQGDYIYMVINSILSDLMWGALFALIILLLFLRDVRPTFITLCSIPISLVFALTAMYFAGVTINIISLSGLAIAVGRLVDDSIVVIENIFRLRAKGFSPVKAAVSGTMQVAGAIVASTLTSICVFLPLVFVEGLTRQIFKDFALTFAFALIASLMVAMTLVPTLASNMLGRMEPKEHRGFDRVVKVYDKALVWSLRHKAVILGVTVVLLIGSVGAVMTKGFEYMPNSGSNQLALDITMQNESSIEDRRGIIDEAEARLLNLDGVSTVGLMSGGDDSGGALIMLMGGNSSSGALLSNVTSYVILEEGADSDKLTVDIKEELSDLDMEVSISSGDGMDASALSGSGITINIFSDDMNDLLNTARIISDAIAGVEGIQEIDDGMDEVTPEIRFSVDRTKAAEYGLTTAQVFQQVNAALTKESNSTQVIWNGDSFNVMVSNEYALDEELTPAYIKNLSFSVTKRDGTIENVKLTEIATISEGEALPSVLRENQKRYQPVSITIAEDSNVTLVSQDVEAVLARLDLPDGVTYDVTGENATIMDAFSQLGLMLILGLLLVYLIMVAQFQSLKNPFIIMFTIPLAFTGGFIALYITGQVLSVVALIGFAMLVGVIVANAIVLVDYINRLRIDGSERVSAIREAAATRMRPILMTALTTIGALIMMAIGVGEGSTMMQPLAIVSIGGLAYGTLMTLFVIPIIYDIFSKKEIRVIASEDLVFDRDA